MLAADAAIQKKIYGSGGPSNLALHTTELIISNEEIEDIIKIVKSFEGSGLLIKGISETVAPSILGKLYVNAENVTYFDSFAVKHIPKEIRKFLRNKNITTNIHWVQVYDSIMCRYYCIGFINFMLKGKSL